jgi:arylformamidase
MIYDISQTISPTIAVWPGDQKFRQRWSMRLASGDSCNVSAVTMSVHTGTHIDAPYHFDEAGIDISRVPLEHYLGPARVVAVPGEQMAIDGSYLSSLDWNGVERVLFKTGASGFPEDRFRRDYVCLTEDGAEFLGKRHIQLVGIDSPSVDAFDSKTMACHKILLRCRIAILEGARLGEVPPADYELICLPLKFAGLDASPVRAILRTL